MNNFTYMTDRNFSKGRKYIGASDMATLANVNQPYSTPVSFWEEYTGRKESFKGNARTAAGHLMEPTILGEYIRKKYIEENTTPETTEETKKIIAKQAKREASDFIVSRNWGEANHENYHSWTECSPKDKPRFVAHADLLDLNGEIPILIQAKNTGQFAADQNKKNPFKGYSKKDLSQNGVNIGVYLQEQWEMYCYGINKAYVAVLIDGWDWRLYGPIHYNKKDVEKLVVLAEKMLWHIDNDVPPEPKNWPDVLSLFPNMEKNTKTVLTPEEEIQAKEMISQHVKYKESIRVLNEKCLDIEMALAMLASEPKSKIMRNFLTTSTGEKVATFSDRAGRKMVSLKELEKHPDLFSQCEDLGIITETTGSRQIRINGTGYGSVELFTALTFGEDDKISRSRKKYNKKEKDALTAFAKSTGMRLEWEKYSN